MIYLDNSATTFPKPPEVQRAVVNAVRSYGFNPGRAGYRQSLKTAEKVYEARETVRSFFNASSVENVIFTPGCTHALNTVIKGVLKPGDHVIISSFEHNAVARPVFKLAEQGAITYSVAKVVVGDDEATIDNFRQIINPHTRLIICTHASNVFGFRLPAERLCALAHSYKILFCLDAAQTAGVFPIDIQNDGYDFVCCAGHKYLYGPMGIGLLLIGNDIIIDSLVDGGTGSASAELSMPSFYPDKLEAGTLNISGILGLQAGISFIDRRGIHNVYEKERRMIDSLCNSLRRYRGIRLYLNPSQETIDAPVMSFSVNDIDSETVAKSLSQVSDIAVRGGLHCAPLAHQSMGTQESGTVRVAPSLFTKSADLFILLNSLQKFR
ncbi:MAG: aminotransferase class V-fold PLP-dependent enzyme [Ruminococcus sp.]|nr:aminotransferase class V-fold PLP-dependent enzyme [Ruminococcus sp.]